MGDRSLLPQVNVTGSKNTGLLTVVVLLLIVNLALTAYRADAVYQVHQFISQLS